MPSASFVGTINAVINAGLIPVFCDVDIDTQNITVETLNAVRSRRTVAVIGLHYGGNPFEYGIVNYCTDHNLFLIEDNACSPLSSYKQKFTGTWGDFGAWSFDPMKVLAAGDGSIVYSKDLNLIKRFNTLTHLGLDSELGCKRDSKE
jgi:aminotransferase